MDSFFLNKCQIKKFGRPFFIADIGANHDGDVNRAFKLIELAKESGLDAVKFQNFSAESIISPSGFGEVKHLTTHQNKWNKSTYETFQSASMDVDWIPKLAKKCNEIQIEFLSTPYNLSYIKHLDPYVNAFKIGSGDITYFELLKSVCKIGKPVILGTGASSLEDVKAAYDICTKYNCPTVLMQCNTNYDGSKNNLKYSNIKVIEQYYKNFPCAIIGLSDHTPGFVTTLSAITLGASVIEKHFTDDKSREGPDHSFAMDPSEWRELIRLGQETYCCLGDGYKTVETNELHSIHIQRRGLYFKADLPAGKKLVADDISFLRPWVPGKFPANKINDILGKSLQVNVKRGAAITHDLFADCYDKA